MGAAMDEETRTNRPRSNRLHPLIYKVNAALLLWMAFAAWGFVGKGYAPLVLAVVTGLTVIALIIPYALWHIWQSHRPPGEAPARMSFHDWLLGDMDTWQTRLRGTDAAIQAMLPLGAGAVGMTAFAIIKHFAAMAGAG
jgi:hypothetical protein